MAEVSQKLLVLHVCWLPFCASTACSSRNDRSSAVGQNETLEKEAKSDFHDIQTSDPLAIIERAIKAHGGDAAFGSARAGRVKTEFNHQGLSYVWCDVYELPDRLSREVRSTSPADSRAAILVENGGQSWIKDADGSVRPFQSLPVVYTIYPLSFFQRLLDLRDKGYSLVLLSQENCPRDGLIGLRVPDEGRSRGDYFFDATKGLLVEHVCSYSIEYQGGQKHWTTVTSYSDFRKFAGMTIPTLETNRTDGEKGMERRLLEFETLERVDDALFRKPE